MYARGILFGKMKYELGDHSFVRCPETGLVADLEFKTKGYFGGTYNAIGGFIKDMKTDKSLYELSGLWNEEMYIKDLTVCIPYTMLSDPKSCSTKYNTTPTRLNITL
jgi:oxysterol-binding protein-related protein 8